MAVYSVDLKKDGRQIRQKFEGQWRKKITTITSGSNITRIVQNTPVVKTTGQVVFVVDVTEKDEQPISILCDRRLPQLSENYVENGVVYWGVYYIDAVPRFVGPAGAYYRWEITYTLGGEFSKTPTPEAGSTSETILNFSTSTELEDIASAVDLNGNWNVNSIGDFFADPITLKFGILNLNYSRREYSNPLSRIFDFFQTVNSSSWYGLAAGTVLCSDISFRATETTSETTYDVDYKLQYRSRGWNVEKANSGLYYASGGYKYRALNDDGSPTEEPILLAANGTPLAPGASPVFETFKTHPSADFSALNLPDPFNL